MAKLTLDDLANLQNNTGLTKINSNFARIETALENTLSRDGTSPNDMDAHLDMNSHRIYNLGAPVNNSDAVRKIDLINKVIEVGDPVNIVAANITDATDEGVALITGDHSDRYEALNDFGGTSAADLADALADGSTVTLVSTQDWELTPNSADSLTILSNLGNIEADGPAVIKFPAAHLSFNTDDYIGLVTAENANLELHGADPLELEWDIAVTDTVTITGSSGAYSVTIPVDDASQVAVGDVAYVHEVAPVPYLFGDIQAPYIYRGRVVAGELCNPYVMTGVAVTTASSGTVTFSPASAGTFTIDTSANTLTFSTNYLSNDEQVYLETTGSLGTGVSTATIYYVINRTATTVQLSLTQGGSAIDLGGTPSGTHTARWAIDNWIKVGDLFTIDGQTVPISSNTYNSITSGTGLLHSGSWNHFVVTVPATGTLELTATSTSVTGNSTLFTTEGEVGYGLLFLGEIVEVSAIGGATGLTMRKASSSTTSTVPYSWVSLACLHMGAHLVTAVNTGANTITVLNKSRVQPATKRITSGKVDIIRTTITQTGTGDALRWEQNGALRNIKNIAFIGSSNSSTNSALAINGRVESWPYDADGEGVFGDATQNGYRGTLLASERLCVLNFGRAVFVGQQCFADLRTAAISGSLGISVWALDSATVNGRFMMVTGGAGTLLQMNMNSVTTLTEAFFGGGAGDAFKKERGAAVYTERMSVYANGAMGGRITGDGGCEIQNSVFLFNRLSSLYLSCAVANLNQNILACDRRCGVEADGPGDATLDLTWCLGRSGTGGYGIGYYGINGARAKGYRPAFNGNNTYGVRVGNQGSLTSGYGDRTVATFGQPVIRRNLTRSVLAQNRAEANVPDGDMDGVEVSTTTGGRVNHHGATVSNSPTGVSRVNEHNAVGGWVGASSATAVGFAALNVGMGTGHDITTIRTGTDTWDIANTVDDDTATKTVTVTGATTSMVVIGCQLNTLPAGWHITGTVTSTNTVTVTATNKTGADSNPASGTIRVVVMGIGI